MKFSSQRVIGGYVYKHVFKIENTRFVETYLTNNVFGLSHLKFKILSEEMKWHFFVGANFIPVGYLLAYDKFRVETAKSIPDGPA